MTIYAMSDIHGHLDAFNDALARVDLSGDDSRLILLGDYIHGGGNSYGVIERIMELQTEYGERVVALAGNHEEFALDGSWRITDRIPFGINEKYDSKREARCMRWMEGLPLYYVEGHIIFVHAGINEYAGELWELGTSDFEFTSKYPAEKGHFYLDWKIVAGHVGTSELAGDGLFKDIYYDGESHYYIDGEVNRNGVIPVLKIDMENGAFYQVREWGDEPILPFYKIK